MPEYYFIQYFQDTFSKQKHYFQLIETSIENFLSKRQVEVLIKFGELFYYKV